MSTSMPSRSRTALRYSDRFSRCAVIGRPTGGRSAAARSSSVSSHETMETRTASSGRRTCGGGISPPRTFRTTRSRTSAWAPTSVMSTPCSETGTVPRSKPASLWQARQYRFTNSRADAPSETAWAWLAGGARAPSSTAAPTPPVTLNSHDMVTTLPSRRTCYQR